VEDERVARADHHALGDEAVREGTAVVHGHVGLPGQVLGASIRAL